MFREAFRRFLAEAVVPFHLAWEREGLVPRELWREAGRRGLLCPTVPEEYGGAGGDFGFCAVGIEEIARVNATGLGFAMHSDVVAPYIARYGSEALKRRVLPPVERRAQFHPRHRAPRPEPLSHKSLSDCWEQSPGSLQ